MSLYQNSVLKKYLKRLDKDKVDAAWEKFTTHFHSPVIQENIRNSKEEQYQGEFLIDLFVNVLGYTKNPHPNFNLTTELKNVKGAKKADGAIISPMGLNPLESSLKVHAVIELKGTKTTDLAKIEQQAFGYKNNQPGCVYVITSNFEKLRFYIDNTVDFEDFNLFQLTREGFEVLWLCLSSEYLLKNTPKQIKDESLTEEERVTKHLYKDYSLFRNELFASIQKNNPEYDKLTLFKKTQKLLDRFLFIFFAEDRLLLPPNSIREIIKQWTTLRDELDEYVPLYSRFKKYFGYMNTGHKGKKHDIFAYNGGLFAPDEILDNIKIDDTLLYTHSQKLSNYDFESEVSVNILGHIFEHSLNEIEEIQAEIEGIVTDKSKTKRKKDGVFYTPKYITKYIVDNTVGKLCEAKKTELGIDETEYEKDRKGRKKATLKSLVKKLDDYREWLLALTICDPACGSGAFLNQALEFLISEHGYIDELKAKLLGGAMVLSEVENTILENNLYGVDINQESVEIAKLSLWLRTAQKGRKLTSLNNNIKCGNSLIDDSEVAGDKAFHWQREFPKVFRSKDKQAFHVVLTTHNSRTSQRMLKLGIEKGEPFNLNLEQEIALTRIIGEIIKEKDYQCVAYNVCKDHVHLVLVCEHEELTDIVKTIKGKSSYMFQSNGFKPIGRPLWSQKFFRANTDVWELASLSKKPGYIYKDTHLDNAIHYVYNNRKKHQLPPSDELQNIINDFVVDQDTAFALEYKGGFDVVIGNPPYGASISTQDDSFYRENYSVASYQIDTYVLFCERGNCLLSNNGKLGFIIPSAWVTSVYDKELREYLLKKTKLDEIVIAKKQAFADATVETLILQFSSGIPSKTLNIKRWDLDDVSYQINLEEITSKKNFDFPVYTNPDKLKIVRKIQDSENKFDDYLEIIWGVKVYKRGMGKPAQTGEESKEKKFHLSEKREDTDLPLIGGKNIQRYSLEWNEGYLKYGKWLAEPRTPDWFFTQEPRIVVREVTSKGIIQAAILDSPMVFSNSVDGMRMRVGKEHLIYCILGIINSKLLSFYHSNSSPNSFKDAFPKVLIKDLREMPLPQIDTDSIEDLSEKVKSLIHQTKEPIEITSNFLQLLQSKYALEKPSKKLKNWHELEFGVFLKELEKARKKAFSNSSAVSSNGFKPIGTKPPELTEKQTFKPIGLAEQAEWMQYFNEQKSKVQALQSDIAKTDHDIDQIVYQLYGLTEEEIQIVEAATM